MTRRGIRLTTGQDLGRLSPCVCNTLRMVARAVTQLFDDVLRPHIERGTSPGGRAAALGPGARQDPP